MLRALSHTGAVYKLESSAGTLLGTIMVPNQWNYYIQMRERVEFAVPEPSMFSEYASAGDHFERGSTAPMICYALLARSHGNYRDALMLFGITPEAFECLPGCAFMPGAAYLRSIAA